VACQKFIAGLELSHPSIGTNQYWWNIIILIVSISTLIHTTTNYLPTILITLHFFILLRTFQSPRIMIGSCAYIAWTRLAGIAFGSLIMCSASSFSVTIVISTQNIFKLYPLFKWESFERERVNEIWVYMVSFISYQWVYNPIFTWSNSSCCKVNLNILSKQSSSFRPQFFRWNQSARPSALHLCKGLGVIGGIYEYDSAPSESQL